jgi:hypothetical protein
VTLTQSQADLQDPLMDDQEQRGDEQQQEPQEQREPRSLRSRSKNK